MTITLTRTHIRIIIALLVFIAGALVWIATPETCGHWKDRYVDALSHSLYGGADDRAAARQVRAERPEGCN